jgi:hypothetical protein
MELASCHESGDYNFELALRFLENFYTPDIIHIQKAEFSPLA